MELDKFFEGTQTSTVLPAEVKQIRAVNRKENRYERQAIEKAGFQLINKTGTKKVGYLTMWRNKFSPNILMFVEKTDGFLYYGGIAKPQKS